MKKSYLLFLFFAVTGLVASAQGQSENRSEGPDPGVARISLIHGDVSMQRGDSGDWMATTLNTPIVRGDTVATSDRSRAEIQLDYADVLRLSGQSQARISDLSRSRIQVQVSQGYANFTIFKGGDAEVEIDTPNVAIRPLRHGRYRVEVNSDSETSVIVRDGEAEVSTPEGSTTVKEGDLITVRGTDSPEYKVAAAPGSDDWDNWNRDRDNIIRSAEGVRRTNAYYTGANDLDTYGHWVYVPGYGDVWAPYQQAAWAPYQDGRWVWEPYYGWTWVSYEPWGWAPYHYGRWFVYADNWYWWPGPIYPAYRPVWSPAFVFFLGFGHHVDFGFGFSSIAWCPVGPFDSFYPWWGRGFNRINVVNITNVNVTNINVINRGVVVAPLGVRGRQPVFSNVNMALTNARVRRGITTVSAENFGRGAGRFERGMDVTTLRQARVATGNLGVVPTRESLQMTNKGVNTPPAGIRTSANNHFFAKTQPPAGLPSFHEQATRVQDVVRAHAGEAQTAVSSGMNRPGNTTSARNDIAAVGRTGQQQGGKTVETPQGNSGGNRFGWHTFPGNAAQRSGDSSANPGTSRSGNSGRLNGTSMGAASGRDPGRTFPTQGPTNSRGAASNPSGGNREGWNQFGSQPRGQGTGSQGSSIQNRGGWNRTSSDRPPVSTGTDRTGSGGPAQDRGGWNRMSSDRPSVSTGTDRTGSGGPAQDRGGWNGRGGAGSGRDTSYRPPLNLNKPIVVPRGNDGGSHSMPSASPRSGGYGGGSYGGGGGNHGYSGGGGSYYSSSGSSGGSYGGGGGYHGSSGGGGSYHSSSGSSSGGSHSSGGGAGGSRSSSGSSHSGRR